MPTAKNVSWFQLRVGLVALMALAILAILIFLLTSTGGLFANYANIRTYMEDASGMAVGAPVRLNGLLVGNVDQIRLSGSPDPNRAVEFLLGIREGYLKDIPVDSVAEISASNLLGDKFINITRGSSKIAIKRNGELKSLQPEDIPELMAESAKVLETLQNITKRTDALLSGVEAGKGNIGKFMKDEELYNRLNGIAAESQGLLSDIRHGKGTLSRLIYDDALYQDLRAPLQRIDVLLDGLQRGEGTAGMLLKNPDLYKELQSTTAEIRLLMQKMNAGKGTAGKLLNDDQLYTRVDRLVANLDRTIEKMNSGQGTLGQLIVNPQLYESLNGTTREMQALLRDIHRNPKRFLSLKLGLF